MSNHEVNLTVFRGVLNPRCHKNAEAPVLELCLHAGKPKHYSIVSQSISDISDPENSPSISMWAYLLASAQTQRLNEISIYSEQGTTADKVRFLYFNDPALAIWRDMKKSSAVMSRIHRPPRGAKLAFGMPFSE